MPEAKLLHITPDAVGLIKKACSMPYGKDISDTANIIFEICFIVFSIFVYNHDYKNLIRKCKGYIRYCVLFPF